MGESRGREGRPWALWPRALGPRPEGEPPAAHPVQAHGPRAPSRVQTARDTAAAVSQLRNLGGGRVLCRASHREGPEVSRGGSPGGESPQDPQVPRRPATPRGHTAPAPSPSQGPGRAQGPASMPTEVMAKGLGGGARLPPSDNERHSLSATSRTFTGAGAIPPPFVHRPRERPRCPMRETQQLSTSR